MEAIVATSSAETSDGTFTIRILEQMRRQPGLTFVAAARRVARENSTNSHQLPLRSGNVQSPEVLAPAPLRRALVLAQADYEPPNTDLHDVARGVGPRGRLRVALEGDYGDENVSVARDLTADQMRQHIHQAIADISSALGRGQRGELMVNYQGHGIDGGMVGRSDALLSANELAELAAEAQRANVHLVVVSDACYQGPLVGFAQAQSFDHLQERAAQSSMASSERHALAGRLAEGRRITATVTRILYHAQAIDLVEVGSAPARSVPAAVREMRDWMRIHGWLFAGENVMLSGGLNDSLRAFWASFVAEEAEVTNHTDLHRLTAELGRVHDGITEEMAQLLEHSATVLDLDG